MHSSAIPIRLTHVVTTISLPLLLAGCAEDTSPPSGPITEPTQVRAARASATAVERIRFQIREAAVTADFSSIDPSGCLETFVSVFGAEQTLKQGAGTGAPRPLAAVQVIEFNFCTNEVPRSIFGQTDEASFQASKKLTDARLLATIPAFDVVSEVEVQVVVDLAWTGTGELTTQSNRFRLKTPGRLVSQWSKGTSRPAEVSGTVAVGVENVATNPVQAEILRARSGFYQVERLR